MCILNAVFTVHGLKVLQTSESCVNRRYTNAYMSSSDNTDENDSDYAMNIQLKSRTDETIEHKLTYLLR